MMELSDYGVIRFMFMRFCSYRIDCNHNILSIIFVDLIFLVWGLWGYRVSEYGVIGFLVHVLEHKFNAG